MDVTIDPAVEALATMRALRDNDGDDEVRTILRAAEITALRSTPMTRAGAIDLLTFIAAEVHHRDMNPDAVTQAIWRCIKVLEGERVSA
jgi:hypothetical protein